MNKVRTLVLKISLLSCVLILGLSLGANTASAHAYLVRSDPADSAELSQAPTQISLWFSEGVVSELSKATLVDNHGQTRQLPLASSAGAISSPGAEQTSIAFALPALSAGVYEVDWRTVSSDDLHETSGTIVFSVQQALPARSAEPTAPPPDSREVLFHWLYLAGLAALSGSCVFALFAGFLETGVPTAAHLRRRFLSMAVLSALFSLLSGFGSLAAQQNVISGHNGPSLGVSAWLNLLLQTRFGQVWLAAQTAMLVVFLAGLLLLRFHDNPIFSRFLMGCFLVCLIALHALQAVSSHPVTVLGLNLPHLAINTLHLLSASLWAGGLLALAIIVLPLLRGDPPSRALGLTLLRSFGPLAAASVAVLAVTGLYLSGHLVASLDALVETRYGVNLALKVGLVLIAGLMGFLNSSSLHAALARFLGRLLRRPDTWKPFSLNALRTTVMLESGLVSVILVLAASLGVTQPALGVQFDPPVTGSDKTTAAASVHDLFLTLAVKPNHTGQNFINLGVFNTRRPAPAAIGQVQVRFTPPDSIAPGLNAIADIQSDGRYLVSGVNFDTPGVWKILIVVQRPGLPDTRLEVPWTVPLSAAEAARRPVLLSNQPLAPILDWVSAGLALLLALLAAGSWAYRRYARRSSGLVPTPPESPKQL